MWELRNTILLFLFQNIKQVKITVPKHGHISVLLREVSVQTGVDKDKVNII